MFRQPNHLIDYHIYRNSRITYLAPARKQIKAPKKPLGKKSKGAASTGRCSTALVVASLTYLFRSKETHSKEIALIRTVQEAAKGQSKPSSPAPTKD